jgi:hypothetical protein
VRSITLEQILLLAVLVLVPLLNLALRWLQRRMEAAEPAPPRPEPPATPPLLPPRAERREPLPAVEPPRAAAAAPVAVPRAPARRGPHRPAPLGGLPEIRRAVIMMTILGRCRGLDEPAGRRP